MRARGQRCAGFVPPNWSNLPGNGRFFPNRYVTWLQRSCTTACNRFLHSRGGYVGPIIRRYRILGRITHLSDTLPTLTEDNRAPAGITFEDTDLPVESLSPSVGGSSSSIASAIAYPGMVPRVRPRDRVRGTYQLIFPFAHGWHRSANTRWTMDMKMHVISWNWCWTRTRPRSILIGCRMIITRGRAPPTRTG